MPTPLYYTTASPRQGFKFDRVPSKRASMCGGSCTVHYPFSYGPILDCVFEMADQVANGNGISHDAAVAQVLRDEGWTLLPTHRAAILAKLKE